MKTSQLFALVASMFLAQSTDSPTFFAWFFFALAALHWFLERYE